MTAIQNTAEIYRKESRKRLKQAVGLLPKKKNNKKPKPEIHHKKYVPFEGTVHVDAGYTLNTDEINKMYSNSVSSIWVLLFQSMLVYVLKAKQFFFK